MAPLPMWFWASLPILVLEFEVVRSSVLFESRSDGQRLAHVSARLRLENARVASGDGNLHAAGSSHSIPDFSKKRANSSLELRFL